MYRPFTNVLNDLLFHATAYQILCALPLDNSFALSGQLLRLLCRHLAIDLQVPTRKLHLRSVSYAF